MSRIKILPLITEETPTFEEWLEAEQLYVEVKERKPNTINPAKWYATVVPFIEIKEGSFLTSPTGWGNTPDDAIKSLKRQLSGQLLVEDAYSTKSGRREFMAPVFREED